MIALLGPQRLHPILADELARFGVDGPISVVTAGWQEREAEVDELGEHVRCEVINLRLYERAEEVFRRDPELFVGYRERQETLRRLQRIYRVRLGYTLGQAQDLLRRTGDPVLLDPEREAAMEAVRELDRHHLARIAEIHAHFQDRWNPGARKEVARHREEVASEIAGSSAFAVAGGHVAVLLNRLRLFAVADAIGDLPVFAWSGGAMVLGERVVLFHDSPPQGEGFAEVLESGLGLYDGLLPLPHARHRLRLGDPVRVALLARRFPGRLSLAMDERSRIHRDGSGWSEARGRRLHPDGSIEELAA